MVFWVVDLIVIRLSTTCNQ